MIYYNYYYY